MITQFGLDYGQEISADVVGLEDPEVLLFLNQAKDDIIQEAYNDRNFNIISNLVETNSALTQSADTSGITNSVVYDGTSIHDEFLFYIISRAKITKSFPVIDSEWVTIDVISVIDDNFIETAYHKPMFNDCKLFITSNSDKLSLQVIHDSYTESIDNYIFSYIKKPDSVVATSAEYTLNLALHPIIISRAVTLAVEVMKNERVQTQPGLDK